MVRIFMTTYLTCRIQSKRLGLSRLFFIVTCVVSCTLTSMVDSSPLASTPVLCVQNRVIRVHGRSISILDLQHKLDVVFYRDFPQYANEVEARCMFYQMHWRTVLQDMIDAELILSDAEDKKVEISDGDIREELEAMFGPNVLANLDQLGMTFEEAKDFVRKDLTVKRMLAILVRSKAMQQVTPTTVRQAYREYLEATSKKALWKYQVMTLQADTADDHEPLATTLNALFDGSKGGFSTLITALESEPLKEVFPSFRVSSTYERTEEDLAATYRGILSAIPVGGYSEPIETIDPKNGALSYKIFHLVNHEEPEYLPLDRAEPKLREFLLAKGVEKGTREYLEKLRRQYGISETYIAEIFPKDFEPFVLK